MTDQAAEPPPRSAAKALATAILAGVWLRLVAAAVAGVVEIAQPDSLGFPDGSARAGDILVTFGGAGDGTGVLLALAALVMVWFVRQSDGSTERLREATAGAFGLTAVSAFVQVVGYWLLFSVAPDRVLWSRLIESTGGSLAVAVVALGGVTAIRSLPYAAADRAADRTADRRGSSGFEDDPFVFAVDRGTGDVRAYFTADDAARRTHVYSVEDDEYAFYADDGTVIAATVEQDRVMLRPTMSHDPDELLRSLKAFAVRRGLVVDGADADDPTAYVVPISDWQWLQLWPGWLRWMGRLVRRRP